MHQHGLMITNSEVDILFDRLDKNQDGKISFDEVFFFLI